MTLLIALRRLGVTSIVADSLVTAQIGREANYSFASIKNGVLCPGIIYGVCGDAEGALRFISAARAAIRASNPRETWVEFEQFVSRYRFPQPPHGRFAVALSSRHSGTPQTYVLDSSQEQIVQYDQDVGLMGSQGADMEAICGAYLGAFLTEQRAAELLREYPLKPHDIPHFLVFFLLQQSLGDRAYELQQIGVGGYWSYAWQDKNAEGRQRPGLYVIGAGFPEKLILVLHRYRIAFDTHPELGELMVVTEKPEGVPARWGVVTQNMSDSTIEVNEDALMDEIIGRHRSQPPYEIFIAGSASVVGRPYCFWADVSASGLRPLADLTDFLAPQVRRLIEFLHEEGFEAWRETAQVDSSRTIVRLDAWTAPSEGGDEEH